MTTTAPVKIKLPRVNDKPRGKNLIALLYGPSGSGKTWFAGTAGDRNLYLSIGKEPETIRSKLFQQKVGANPILIRDSVQEYYKEDHSIDVSRKCAFDRLCQALDDALNDYPDEFDTVTLDDATVLDQQLAMVKGMLTAKEVLGATGFTKSQTHKVIIPDIGDYRESMKRTVWFLDTYIKILVAAGKNFLVLGHDRYTFEKPLDVKGNIIVGAPEVISNVRPGFVGKTLPDVIPGMFDEVWIMEKMISGGQTIHRIKTVADEKHLTNTTHAGSFKSMELNPNFIEMWKRLRK
jgi:hypothetical protein